MKTKIDKNKKIILDIFLLIVVLISAGYAWRELPKMFIQADGFIYFLKQYQQFLWDRKYWFTGFEVFAMIAGFILPRLFGPQISLYLLFEVVYIIFIDALFYCCIRIVTRSRLIAFTAALITSVDYFGTWDMYGTLCYSFFLERVMNMPFFILSFMYLHIFLSSDKKLFYFLSLGLFLIGLGLGHFELIIAPVFILYPFWSFLFTFGRRGVWKGVRFGIPFALISIGINLSQRLSYGTYGWPDITLTHFILNPTKYNSFNAIGIQLVHWSDYLPLIRHIFDRDVLDLVSTPQQAAASMPYLLLVYGFVFLILYARLPKFRALLVTCLTGVFVILFINVFMKGYDVVTSPGTNRYLYLPTFFLSIFWAIAVWYFLLKRKSVWAGAGIILIIFYYWVNVTLLDTEIRRTLVWGAAKMFNHIIQTRNALSPNTLVVVQRPPFWIEEEAFFTEQLGKGEVTYVTEEKNYPEDWKMKIPQYEHIIKLYYNLKCSCVTETKVK